MRRQQLSEHLGRVPLFALCSRGDIKILARHMVEVEVPAGATIVTEGDKGDAFYVVIDGEATVSTGRKRGRVLATLGPGGWFGELAVLDPAPRNATVTAKSDMTVGVLGARVFRAVMRDVPALTEKLLSGMARRLRDADRIVNDLGGQSTRAPSSNGRARKAPASRRAQR